MMAGLNRTNRIHTVGRSPFLLVSMVLPFQTTQEVLAQLCGPDTRLPKNTEMVVRPDHKFEMKNRK